MIYFILLLQFSAYLSFFAVDARHIHGRMLTAWCWRDYVQTTMKRILCRITFRRITSTSSLVCQHHSFTVLFVYSLGCYNSYLFTGN